jgi:hypothetical protein
MTRPKLVVVHPEQPEQPKGVKKYRFELGRTRLVFYVVGLTAAMCWMFVFGVLVGRGVSLVTPGDYSLHAGFLRVLGLDRQADQPAERAADTWGDPRKMLETLNYYEDLTQKGTTAAPPAGTAAKDAPQSQAAGEQVVRKLPSPEPDKAAKARQAQPPVAVEQFTLLIASLRDPENAQRLMDQLRAKGYSPRLEMLDLNGGGRYNRILLGSFQNRDAALKFAADFNRKEHMEGLVIREPN